LVDVTTSSIAALVLTVGSSSSIRPISPPVRGGGMAGVSAPIAERRVPELISVLGRGDVSHKPGGRLPLLSARPAVTLATLKRAATSFAA